MSRLRIVHERKPLPKLFSACRKWGKLIAQEGVLKLTRHSRLRVKYLIFDNRRDLMSWYANALGRPGVVDYRTKGIFAVLRRDEEDAIYVDPTYVGIICLIRGHVTPEVVIHECAHAAFAYYFRMRRREWSSFTELEEEEVCYPLGIMSSLLLSHFATENLLDPCPRLKSR